MLWLQLLPTWPYDTPYVDLQHVAMVTCCGSWTHRCRSSQSARCTPPLAYANAPWCLSSGPCASTTMVLYYEPHVVAPCMSPPLCCFSFWSGATVYGHLPQRNQDIGDATDVLPSFGASVSVSRISCQPWDRPAVGWLGASHLPQIDSPSRYLCFSWGKSPWYCRDMEWMGAQ